MRFSPIVLLLAFLTIFTGGCGEAKKESESSGRIPVYSGLPPVAFIASAIGGERVDSRSALPEGRSPHDFSPGPRDIRGVTTAKLFFTTGMSYEKAICRPLRPERTKVIDVSEGVTRIPFDGAGCSDPGHHAKEGHEHGHVHTDSCTHDHEHGDWDPHIWLSAGNATVIAENIRKALTETDPEGAAYYQERCDAFLKQLSEVEAYAKKELAPYHGREFYVYHPAFGYFASMVGLKQVAIELGGREATTGHLTEVIRRARENKVKVVFVQPQFNPTSARALAKAIDGKVAGLDALASDIPANIRAMTDALKEGLSIQEGQ